MSVEGLVKEWSDAGTLSLAEDQVKQLLAEAGLTVAEPGGPAVELRIALQQDIIFGSIVAFSFGRMAMEVWSDVAYRIVPLTEKDARLMIQETQASDTLLHGYHSLPAPDRQSIQRIILRLSELAEGNPQIAEIELDPVYALADRVVIGSARIQLSS